MSGGPGVPDDGLGVLPVPGLPEVTEGIALGELIAAETELEQGDVVVVSQKIVSKAEGRVLSISSAIPGAEARKLAAVLGKDPALVELILAESREVLRAEGGVLIAETHHGFVCANAGVDTSNLPEEGTACLLPEDPDASARRIRTEITAGLEGPLLAVIVSDSFGRAWRLGQAEVAIGCAGISPLDDWRGRADAAGRRLEATAIAIADEAAAAADLVRDKTSGVPAVIVRGLGRHVTEEDGPGAAALRRTRDEDLFR
jgi:coenzyme F420-0:L-glutamate ligase/coenzyme F420-1:gamma-L-glutamate ligase